MTTPERRSGTVTFLFTDIQGSTALLKQLGRAKYGELLARQQLLLREAFAAHGGEEIDTQGDSFFVAFRSAPDAVAAAVAIQRSLADHEWPEGVQVRVRIGIHSGEASAAGERYVGFSVHRAARIGAAGHGGQVLLSDATRVLVEDDLPAGVYLRDLGLWRLKDVDRPERVWQVAAEGLPVDFAPLRGADRVKAQPVLRRRSVLAAALVGVIAAAVAIPVFALGGGSGPEALAGVQPDSVGVVDAASGRITASVPVESGPRSVAVGEGSIWAANTNAGTVSRINPQTRAVEQTIQVGHGPSGIAFGRGKLWVVNSFDGTVSEIDPRVGGGQVVNGAGTPVGADPSGIAFGEGGLWVADSGDRAVVRLDSGSGRRVGHPIQVAAGADAIAAGDGAVWVASASSGVITRIDPSSGSEQTINVGNGPSALAVVPGAVWVLNSLDGTVSRIDPSTNHEVSKFPVGDGATGIAVSDDGKVVWVALDRGVLKRIEQAHNDTKTIKTGNRPTGLSLAGDAVYVTVRASAASHRGGTLTIAAVGPWYGSPAQDFDPAAGGDWGVLSLTNDGLVGYSHAGGAQGAQLVADLAVSLPVPTDDGKNYAFQLRPNIRYSSGEQVRPADFKRAMERALANPQGPGQFFFSGIVGAKGCAARPKACDLSEGIETGASTITFHLSAPDPAFLYKLALPTAVAVPATTPLKAHVPLPATGPYEIASYSANRVRLARNRYFREWSPAQPDGYPDRIVQRWGYRDDVAAATAVERGAADVISFDNTVPASLVSDLSRQFSGQLHDDPNLGIGYIVFNTRVPPFDDVRVRRAVNYAVDRNHWVALRSAHLFQATCQVLPPGIPGYKPYCPYTRNPGHGRYNGPDPARARQLVAASGTRGEKIDVVVTPEGYSPPALNYFVSVLKQLGYRARLVVSAPLYDRKGDSRARVQAMGNIYFADYPLASTFLVPFLSCASFTPKSASNPNLSEFCDRHVDDLMARAQAAQPTDPATAAALWSQVDRAIVDQAPYMVVFDFKTLEFTSARVGNYVFSPFLAGGLLDQMWVK